MTSYAKKKSNVEILEATLDYPVGVNSTYAGSRGALRKTKKAQDWYDKAVSDLRKQGFSAKPDKPYWCSIRYVLKTVRQDIDGPIKSIIDSIAESFGVTTYLIQKVEIKRGKNKGKFRNRTIKSVSGFNDRWVMHVEGHKIRVKHYAEQGLTLRVILVKVKNEAEVLALEKELASQDWSLDKLGA